MRALLAGLPYPILDLADVSSVILPPEGVDSYEANALGKARAVARETGMLALADDSGLEVDALGGRPGLLSARYGGEGLSDEARYRALLAELRGVPAERRSARFRSVAAIAAPDGREATAEGVVEGVILDAPRGAGGFGYDPVFFYPPLGATFGELGPEAKDPASHRGLAIAGARRILLEWLSTER
jgi:XTP/dITP diphosphohydrolase